MSHNRNPDGINGYTATTLSAEDEARITTALRKYHHENLSSNDEIRKRLAADTGITLGISTIKRRRDTLQLFGPRSKKARYAPMQVEQAVLIQLDKDPSNGQGLASIKGNLAFDQGLQIKRSVVSAIMHTHEPEAFLNREPGSKKIRRIMKVPIGIHERWAGDGHDKLYAIGFPIYGIVDDGSATWLGGWVVPSNRMGDIIGYLFLCLIEEHGGMPVQYSTDCGSETTQTYGLVNALREIFYPEYDRDELPAHLYMKSVHNISIERSWLRLKLDFGDNAKREYETFPQCFRPNDDLHQSLSKWIWSKTLQLELDRFMAKRNARKSRKDSHKHGGPSGVSRNDITTFPGEFSLKNMLLPLTADQLKIVAEIKEVMGGEELLAFVPREFAVKAEAAYATLNVVELTMQIAWQVFQDMLPLLSNVE